MNLRAADFYMTRFAHRLPGAMKLLGDLESDLLAGQLQPIEIDRPVFITGLARSGTTILLSLFAAHPAVGTHRYRDFPFLFVPVAWNRLQNRMGRAEEPVERAHRDRIRITRESPEAFEEPIWSHFFPQVHDRSARHVLTETDTNAAFDEFYVEHLRKVLLLRGRTRYVSKGNYNVTRIAYLARLFPDARFVIPVRHPFAQVESLVRQHRLFSSYSAEDPRVPEYMRAAGHYEFGPQRVPVNVDRDDARRTRETWSRGQDHAGYAIMWRAVYAHVVALCGGGSGIGERVRIVRYEDLCAAPSALLRDLFGFCGLSRGADAVLGNLPDISARPRAGRGIPAALADAIWRETEDVARPLGYRREETAL